MTNKITGYKNNPDLNALKITEGWKGTPVDKKGRFLNLTHPYLPNWADLFRWQMQKSPFRKEKKSEVWNPEVYKDDSWLMGRNDVIVWLGHSTFYIRINGVQLLTDPVFFNIPFVKRKSELPVHINRFVHLDFILLSHDHRDHLDEKSLSILAKQNPDVKYLTGLGMKEIIHDFTMSDEIEEAGWYQQYNTGEYPLNIYFIPSRHWSKRGLYDTNRRLWGGFVIVAPNKRILFGGDSGYDKHYKQLAEVFGIIDYAILGIGAYEPAWFMNANHQSPSDALKGFKELNAHHFIPMHYGTFDLSDEPLSQPLKDLRIAAIKNKLEDKLNILTIGQPEVIFTK